MSFIAQPGDAVILNFDLLWFAPNGAAVILDPVHGEPEPPPLQFGQFWPVNAAQAVIFPSMGQIWPVYG